MAVTCKDTILSTIVTTFIGLPCIYLYHHAVVIHSSWLIQVPSLLEQPGYEGYVFSRACTLKETIEEMVCVELYSFFEQDCTNP